jgi:hypothetical protein
MTYTQIGLLAVVLAVFIDYFVLRTRLVRKKLFWMSFAIIVFFQLITNGVLTGLMVVRYDGDAILGGYHPDKTPPFLGDGRIFYAPAEDLLFGASMILLVLSVWVWLGRKGVQRLPFSGPPPKWWPRGGWFGVPRR